MNRSILIWILAVTQITLAQAPPGPVIRSGAQEVLLDLVVRDKREKMVRDLKPEELEVFEDGVKQDIRSFRLVSGAEVRQAEAEAAKTGAAPQTKVNPLREINLVLLVFRMMGPKERLYAK